MQAAGQSSILMRRVEMARNADAAGHLYSSENAPAQFLRMSYWPKKTDTAVGRPS